MRFLRLLRVWARGVGGLPLRCPLSTRGRFDLASGIPASYALPPYPLSVRPLKMPPRPRALNAGVTRAVCRYYAIPVFPDTVLQKNAIFCSIYLHISFFCCTFAPAKVFIPLRCYRQRKKNGIIYRPILTDH
jgi:hypothetical protein